MKKIYSLIFILSVFLIGCGSKDSVTSAITEKPVTGSLTAIYDESNTSKSISVGDTLDSYTGNFELTYNDGTTSSSITVTKDMISLDTSSVGEKVATISYNGVSTTVSAIVCTKASDFTRSVNTITAYSGSASSVVVPRYIDSTEITTLGNAVFKGNTTLTGIIANDIITIADGYSNSVSNYSSTFWACSNLMFVYLPKTTHIGEGSFYKCVKLSSIYLPKATFINNGAFMYCTSLISIVLPETLSIGESTFMNCVSLGSIYLPKVTSIDKVAFEGCTNLISASLPKVTSIGSWAFCKCIKLISVSFESLIAPTLGTNVFSDSGTKTWNINVPESSKENYISIFNSNFNLFYNTSIPTINGIIF